MSTPFTVRLTNFEGPFDLLLQLISRHKLDVTEVALSKVTDEFIGYIRASSAGDVPWDLDQTSSFIVVAASLNLVTLVGWRVIATAVAGRSAR